MFKGVDGGLALDGRKVFKELVQSLSALEVIQKRLERNASPAEHRGSPENIRVPHDDAVGRGHSRISPSVYPSERRKTKGSLVSRMSSGPSSIYLLLALAFSELLLSPQEKRAKL